MKRSSRRVDLELGPLPVSVINRALNLELDAGAVVITRAAQVHVEKRRPEEYARLLPHLARAISMPLYVGDDHRNPGKIELVSRVFVQDTWILIAIAVTPDVLGRYRVVSFYPLKPQQIEARRARGFLRGAVSL